MKNVIKKLNALKILNDSSYLHMVIWKRLDEDIHTKGLLLTKRLVEEYDLIMPLIRPIGRNSPHKDAFKDDFHNPVPNFISKKCPQTHPSTNCELWIQVTEPENKKVINLLEECLKEIPDVDKAALKLKISRSSLYKKLKEHNIEWRES